MNGEPDPQPALVLAPVPLVNDATLYVRGATAYLKREIRLFDHSETVNPAPNIHDHFVSIHSLEGANEKRRDTFSEHSATVLLRGHNHPDHAPPEWETMREQGALVHVRPHPAWSLAWSDDFDQFLAAYLQTQPEVEVIADYRFTLAPRQLEAGAIAVTLREGGAALVTATVYERSRAARRRCIEHFGTFCQVCGFNFAERYGVTGRDYIQVHHLTPLSHIGQSYVVDPVDDLRPVCANCHAMLHRSDPPFSIDELKRMLR